MSDALLGALETGTTVAEEFTKERIIDRSVDFSDSLSKNNLKTFKSIKADLNLFARLAVLGQTQSMDMREVLSHSLDPVPWSLAPTDRKLA